MSTAAPSRTADQRLAALEAANTVRCERAAWKRRVHGLTRAEATACAAALIADPIDWALTWRVEDVLRALLGLGRTKARAATLCAQVSATRSLGALTVRQRLALGAWLARWGAGA